MPENETPIFDKLINGDKEEKVQFVAYAAKAVWAFICAFAGAFFTAIIAILISGRFPEVAEWLTATGLGLAAALGTGAAVYHTTNKDRSVG